MIVNAIIKPVNIDKETRRLDIYSPKFPNGKALSVLSIIHEGKPVKFITNWDDVPIKKPIRINGGIIADSLIGTTTLIRGMFIQCTDDDTIYIVMDPALIS